MQQTLRLTDVELAVESEAAFGLLGAAARAVVPNLQRALLQKMTVDLKPFTSNAEKKIAEVVADLQKNDDGVKVQADINAIRLSDIAYDAKTLRVIAEAQGTITAVVTKLPEL
jgi:predicted nucleotidyltransferase